MRYPLFAALLLLVAIGCNSAPEEIRHETSAAAAAVKSDAKVAEKDVKVAAHDLKKDIRNARGAPGYDDVNLNTAPRLTLMTLPGITGAQAKRIVANRPYASVDDFRNRRIVSSDEFDKIAPRLVTSN